MRHMARSILTIFIVFPFIASAAHDAKALWLVRDILAQNDVKEIVRQIEQSKCNTLFVQLYALGYAFYPSTEIESRQDNDATLRAIIQIAEDKGLKVYAWLNVSYIWGRRGQPASQEHLYYRARDGVLYDKESARKKASEGYYIEPHNTLLLKQLKTVMAEIAQKYNIDGFHLDYFRYPDFATPISKSINTDFYAAYGYSAREVLDSSSIKFYRSFLLEKHKEALAELNDYIKNIDSGFELSIAVKAHPVIARTRFLQDWANWLKEDICDFVVIMNYDPDSQSFFRNLEDCKLLGMNDRIWVGVALYNISESEFKKRVSYIENSNFGGYSVFSFNLLRNQPHLIGSLP